MRKNCFFVLCCFGLATSMLQAKAVKIDQILVEKNSFQLDTTISYSNIVQKNNMVGTIQYQTQNGDFVTIPTYIGEATASQDYINYGLTFRYGLSRAWEMYTSASIYSIDTHINNVGRFETDSTQEFNAVTLGVTYKIRAENKYPAVLIGASTKVLERSHIGPHTKNDSLKSYSFFATTYYSVDPVVLLLRAGYGLNLEQSIAGDKMDRADIITLSPAIYFAVNPYVSLNWGVNYQYKGEDKFNDIVVSGSESSVGFNFGASYEISAGTILNMDTSYTKTVSYSSSNIAFTLSYRF